jgi:hypothetical protein
MRRILVQQAQKRQRKRWIARRRPGVEWTDDGGALINQPKLILAIDRAIQKLFRLDSLHARILECRFFGGMSVEEIAAALSQDTQTAERHWRIIRAWTRRELTEGRGA